MKKTIRHCSRLGGKFGDDARGSIANGSIARGSDARGSDASGSDASGSDASGSDARDSDNYCEKSATELPTQRAGRFIGTGPPRTECVW